jgi:Caspase domain/Domain of unknown function (DUF4384)
LVVFAVEIIVQVGCRDHSGVPRQRQLQSAAKYPPARNGEKGMMLRIAAMMLCLLASQFAMAKNVALLIAVGQFKDPQMKTNQLRGPSVDIDSMQQTLISDWKFAPGDVRALRDQEATHARVLQELSALEQRTAPGDTVVIYYSGHGTSANDGDNGYDLPYATGAWVPYDLDLTSNQSAQRSLVIGRRDLVPPLQTLDKSGRWVVVISDSCYSGQVVRAFAQKFSHSRFLPLNVTHRDLGVSQNAAPVVAARPPPPPYPYQHVVLLSGASDSETGADISTEAQLSAQPTLDGKFHGAFTDAFLRLLKGQLLPGAFNYAQAREAMNAFLEHRNFPQHPQLLPGIAEDPHDVGSMAFFSNALPGSAPLVSSAQPVPAAQAGAVHVRLESVEAGLRAKITALSGVDIVDHGGDLIVSQSGDQVQLLGPAGDPVLKTKAADGNLLKRIAAQAWLNRALPATIDKLGLRADTDPSSRGNTYVQCESFVFEVRLQKSAYIMLLDLDSHGNLTVLYPANPLERRIVPAGVATAIPGADPKDHILVLPPFGTDLVSVLAFEQPPPFFAELTDAQAFGADTARAETIARGLKQIAGNMSVRQVTVNTYPSSKNVACK